MHSPLRLLFCIVATVSFIPIGALNLWNGTRLPEVSSHAFTHKAAIAKRAFTVDTSRDTGFLSHIARVSHPGVAVAFLSEDEFRRFPWSREKRVIKKKRGIKIYYNHTRFHNENKVRQTRYTVSEFIPKPEHLIPRGYTVNYEIPIEKVRDIAKQTDNFMNRDKYKMHRSYSWAFKAKDPYSPAEILMCFYGKDDREKLKDSLLKGINKWHEKLGDRRGVQFRILCDELCYADDKDRTAARGLRLDTVLVSVENTPNKPSSASLGYLPYHSPERHVLRINLTSPNPQDRTMLHELGHVLGLQHEHQRYDAAKYIKLDCHDIPGYGNAQLFFEAVLGLGDWKKFDEIACKDPVGASSDSRWSELWTGASWLPFSNDGEISAPYPHVEDYKAVDDFDYSSIMIYPSVFDGRTRMTKITNSQEDSTPFGWGNEPTNKDVAAVKKMYPDVQTQRTSSAPPKP